MIKITVAQSTVKEVKGISSKNGKPYHMRFQTAYAHTVDKDGRLQCAPRLTPLRAKSAA